VRVVASEDVRSYVEENGGVLYVSARRHQCCSGALVLLDATTCPPPDLAAYRPVETGDFPVRYRKSGRTEPDELVIELRGLRRKRPVAYWNGCAFRM
jgi:hypothetical protein